MKRRVVNLAVFLAALAALGVAVNCIAAHPLLRLRADATKTRAYSLSEQTRRLLAGLDGSWTVALVMTDDQLDPALLRQVDEVLGRFEKASPSISVVRIDPSDPASLDRYGQLLDRLRSIYRGPVAQYDQAIGDARQALQGFDPFVRQQAAALVGLRQALGGKPAPRELDELLAAFALRPDQLREMSTRLDAALTADEHRPLPDYETARSLLVLALGRWSEELHQVAKVLGGLREDPATVPPLREFAAAWRADYEGWAQELAGRADPLKHLEPLELGRVARSLEAGETAIVLGPTGASVISADQLMPRLNLRQRGSGEVTFDRRFRGEQAIAAAIRTLNRGALPLVYLVHAEDRSLLAPRAQNVDFVGSARMLQAARYEVREWIVGQAERPRPPSDRPAVWVVMPPPIMQRRSIAISDAERRLLEAAQSLLDDGQPVLLSLCPSAASRTGQPDPWAALVQPLGLEADTVRVLYERQRDQQGEVVNQRVQQLSEFSSSNPIALAVDGQQTALDLPVTIRPAAALPPGAHVDTILSVEPDPQRWLDPDWLRNPAEARPGSPLAAPAGLIVAAERRNPVGTGVQRVLVVGSGGWALSYLADLVMPLGGDRMVLMNPGNYELLQAGIAWLAGADDLIAAGPVSNQVARLTGVSDRGRLAWDGVAIGLLPAAWLALGLGVWAARRQ